MEPRWPSPAWFIGGVLLRPGAPGGPQIAFADVEKALSDSRYITWTMTQQTALDKSAPKNGVLGQKKSRSSQSAYWVEVHPLRMAIRDTESGFTMLGDSSHYEGKNGDNNYYWESHSDSGVQPLTSIKQLVLSPLDPAYPELERRTKWHTSQSTPWKRQTVQFQGRAVLHFSRATTIESVSLGTRTIREEQVWVDPTNRHLLRRESSTEHSQGLKSISIADNFRYVDSAPEGTFDPVRPEPGEDYLFSNFTASRGKLTVKNKEFDQSIRAQIKQVVSAINAADAGKLSALGDAKLYASDGPEVLNGKTRAQREAYLRWYLKYVAKRRILRNWKIEALPSRFNLQIARWHRYEEGGAYPPTGPQDVNVGFLGTATLANGQRRRVLAHATFRLTPSGPRLTWFNPKNYIY